MLDEVTVAQSGGGVGFVCVCNAVAHEVVYSCLGRFGRADTVDTIQRPSRISLGAERRWCHCVPKQCFGSSFRCVDLLDVYHGYNRKKFGVVPLPSEHAYLRGVGPWFCLVPCWCLFSSVKGVLSTRSRKVKDFFLSRICRLFDLYSFYYSDKPSELLLRKWFPLHTLLYQLLVSTAVQ